MRVYVIAFVSALVLTVGCRTLEVTPDEYKAIEAECQGDEVCMLVEEEQLLDEKREQMIYEREDRRLQEREEILGLMIACAASGNILITRRSAISRPKGFRRAGPPTMADIPRHAHRSDYMCVTPDTLHQILRQRAESEPSTDTLRYT